MAEQRIRLCGHFGSVEFEQLQILQGRHRGKQVRFLHGAAVAKVAVVRRLNWPSELADGTQN
jgi:hypothetical protein